MTPEQRAAARMPDCILPHAVMDAPSAKVIVDRLADGALRIRMDEVAAMTPREKAELCRLLINHLEADTINLSPPPR